MFSPKRTVIYTTRWDASQTKHCRMRYDAVFGPGSALRIARSLALGGGCEAHFDKLAEVLTRGPQWAGVAACTG